MAKTPKMPQADHEKLCRQIKENDAGHNIARFEMVWGGMGDLSARVMDRIARLERDLELAFERIEELEDWQMRADGRRMENTPEFHKVTKSPLETLRVPHWKVDD